MSEEIGEVALEIGPELVVCGPEFLFRLFPGFGIRHLLPTRFPFLRDLETQRYAVIPDRARISLLSAMIVQKFVDPLKKRDR